MKKKFFLYLILIFNFSAVSSEEGIYFLNVDHILNNTKTGKIIIEKLEKINSNNITEIKIKEENLKKLEKEISTTKNVISSDELNNKIKNFKNEIALYKSHKDQKNKEFKELRDKELNIFFKEITPHIEDFMEINSIKIILDKKNIFIANSNYDITEKLIEYINTKY